MAGHSTSDPTGWKLTSVRWIEQNHPEYYRARRNATAHEQLSRALAAMSWKEADAASEEIRAWVKAGGTVPQKVPVKPEIAMVMRAEQLTAWGKEQHEEMVRFLKDGGYAVQVERMRSIAEFELSNNKGTAADSPPLKSSPTADGGAMFDLPGFGSW